MCGIELLLFYLEPISFGINTHTWRKCSEILLVCMNVVYIFQNWTNCKISIYYSSSKFIRGESISRIEISKWAILNFILILMKLCFCDIYVLVFHVSDAGARQVFERWMEWEPEEQAWHSYINFELRYKELDRARHIYERFVMIHPEVKKN